MEEQSMQVKTESELQSAIESISDAEILAIDTEFMREKTYYPLLCLVQIATESTSFIIDPLAVKDLTPLASVLTSPKTVKVLHASRQDREMLFNACGVVPSPIFDTQLAAPLLGLQQQIGLKALVEEILGVRLSKRDSLSDWSKRPLSKSQIEYSLDDVRYLVPLYREMCKRLDDLGRRHWLDSEFEALGEDSEFGTPESELWSKVKKTNSLSRAQRACAQGIAVWRENCAKRSNIPRRWILQDELIVELSRRQPKSVDEVYEIRGAKEKLNTGRAREIVKVIETALASDPDTWPRHAVRKPTAANADAMVDLLTAFLRTRAKENMLTHQVLATHDDLIAFVSGQRAGLDILKGWRYEIAGRDMLEILEGRISLRIEDGNISISRADG